MKNSSYEISAMHSLRAGELQELERRLAAFSFTPELMEKKAAYDEEEDIDSSDIKDYQVINGTAVYKISGPLLTSSSFFSRYFGYVSYEDVRANAISMIMNPEVQDVLLMFSSPGGSAFGVSDGAEALTKLAAAKPMYAYTNSNMASGAYWLGSNARQLFMAPEAEVGSVGVVVTHTSFQEAMEEEGIKVTIIKSSALKAVGSPFKNLTDAEVEHIQSQVDQIDSIFKSHVIAKRPGIKASALNGATFIGEEAVKVGLADSIMSYDQVMATIAASRKTTQAQGGFKMTREELKIALESGVTLEELGLTQEEVDVMLVEEVQPEPEVVDPPVADPTSVDVDLIAELNAKIAELSASIVEKDAKIADLSGKLEGFEGQVGDLKAIAAEITVNRRTALGFQSTVDLTKFSTESLLAEYKAVSEEFNKAFKVGGILKNKHVTTEEPKPSSQVADDSFMEGQLRAANITR